MDSDSYIPHIITEDFYEDIAGDVERWFDTSNYDENDKRPLPIGKNKKVIGLFKDELGGRIMKEFCALRAKTYSYLMDDNSEVKKDKGTKKCIIKWELMFENYKSCLFNGEVILKSQQRFKSDHHEVYTEEVNKIALNSNDDKRLQTFDRIMTYPYGANALRVCESEMLKVCEAKEKLKMLIGKIRRCKAKMKLETQSYECERDICLREKDKCKIFLKNVKAKCKSMSK